MYSRECRNLRCEFMTLTQLLAVLVFTPVSSFTQLGNPSLIRGHPLHAAQGQPPPDVAVSRRAALGTVFHGALLGLASQLVVSEPAFAASGIGAQAERGAAEYGSLEKIEEYAAAIKACRRAVANPEIEVKAKRKDVERTISRVVEPLIDAMLLNELSFELSDAQLAKGAALPQEMKVGLHLH